METSGGRQPTSHEVRAGESWDASYREGSPPWDIGRPQSAFVRLASETSFVGPVLDAGCGTGEHALMAASQGLSVVGVDVSETALAIARAKADKRGLKADFIAADALHLERFGRRFATVLDCGLFHTFNRNERADYVASLASVTELDGTLYMLCFSDQGSNLGPYPISEKEIPAAFQPSAGWTVTSIRAERIDTRLGANSIPAWLATVRRT